MARPKRKAAGVPGDVRVAAVVLKDTPEYRDWLTERLALLESVRNRITQEPARAHESDPVHAAQSKR